MMNEQAYTERLTSNQWQFYMVRMVWYCFLIGVIGAASALAFNYLVQLVDYLFLESLAGYSAPEIDTFGEVDLYQSNHLRNWLIPVATTLGALLAGWLVCRFAPETGGAGTSAVVKSYHHHGGRMRARVPVVKAIASALTIGSGGAAGKQGPMAQIVAGLASIVADQRKFSDRDRRMLVLAGMAAGLAAIFRSPFGAAIFVIEVLYYGMEFEARLLIYTTIAAVTAYAINGLFMGWTPIFHLEQGLTFHRPVTLILFIILGILAGMYGAVIPKIFYGIRDWFTKWKFPNYLKPAIGGLLVGLMALLFPQILGGGYGWMQQIIDGQVGLALIVVLLVIKVLAMSFTIGSGGSGGIFAPTLFTGLLLGVALAQFINLLVPAIDLNIQSFAVVGMAAVFAGVARVPVAALMMAVEMTGGYGLIVPTMIAVVISYMVQSALTRKSTHRTIYENQVLDRSESPVHHNEYLIRTLELLRADQFKKYQVDDALALSLDDLIKLRTPVKIEETGQYFYLGIIRNKSRWIGKPLKEIRFPEIDIRILVAIHNGISQVPNGDTILQARDKILLVSRPEFYDQLKADVKIPHLDLQRK